MFHKRTFKVLSNLILLAVLCTGQVAAAPNSNADEVVSFLSNSTLTAKFSRQAFMAVGDTIRTSLDSSGAQGNSDSSYASISADGRYVAFTSLASNLANGDTNDNYDVFVRDTQTNTTQCVSVNLSGAPGNGPSYSTAISADGRYIAFASSASNLINGDMNGAQDIFVRDMQTNTTQLVSRDSNGVQASGISYGQSISADGRYVAFASSASNLVSGDTNGARDVFLRDTQMNTTIRVSVDSTGAQGNSNSAGYSYITSISANGRYVVFESLASNLVSGDTNGMDDVFVRDTQMNTTTRISVASSGTQGNSGSSYASISADGRYVAFDSYASNLVSGDTNGVRDIFLRNTQTNITTRVSLNSSGEQGINYSSSYPSISTDGRYVAFQSGAGNLVSGDTNGVDDVLLRDTQANTTVRVSVDSSGAQGNWRSGAPSISNDGRYIAFESDASNLVSGDTNAASDIFVHQNDVPSGPFLDLPVQYSNFSVAANGNYGGNNPGRVNSWFDHNTTGQIITTWAGNTYTGAAATSPYTCNRESCYDGHNGIDFRNTQNNELIYAATNGTVFGVVNNCSGCTGYGNRVWIDHHNGYATLYGHLNTVSVTNGTEITDRVAQHLGVMGSTGNSTGVHLHFGLYYDQNGDGLWSESEAVDPYGIQGVSYLWIHPLSAQQQIDGSGGSASDPSGNLVVTIPVGAVVNLITLELWDTPPVAGASATLRSIGNSFRIRVLEWLAGGGSPSLMAGASTNTFDVPVTITVHYDPSAMPHLDTSQLTINQWDDVGLAWIALPTTLDAVNQQASAQTSQPGNFDLQAPLVCPADTLEPNDNYDGASVAQTDGTLVSNLFDMSTDEDWFKFDAVAGTQYDIQTSNLVTGVDTALEIYAMDGVTLLVSDDNGGGGSASSLSWQAPQDGLYFARVKQASASSFGCSSGYDFSVTGNNTLIIVSENGLVAKNPDKATYREGDVVQLTAMPNTGWSFADWTGDLISSTNPDSVTIHGNTSVTANYAINTYTLTYMAGSHGSLTGTSPQTVNYGANGTTVTAIPDMDYHFISWSDGILTASRMDTNVTGDINVTANFEINTYTLIYNAETGGAISGTTPQTVNHGANGTTVTAVPDMDYHFISWSDGILTAARTDTNVTSDISVTANFGIDTHTLTYTAGANGSISGTSPQTVNYGANGTEVTAVADANYHFVNWSDDMTTAPRTDTNITADLNVTANFALDNQAPTDIMLSNNKVAENMPIGTMVGMLSTTDPDTGDTFTYSFACTTPGADDSSFAIAGNNINTAASFNFEVKKSYAICIRTTDSGGLFFDKNFSVTVTDVNEETAKNGGFNLYPAGKKVPTNWVAALFATTDGKDTAVRKEGVASVKIAGATGKVKTLTQAVTMSGPVGDTFTFSYWVKANQFSIAGLCQAQVSFYSGSALKGTKTVKCPTGTTYAWKQAKLSFTAPAAYTKVMIKFTFSKASGTVWFDLVSLAR
jgi:murein DD-endopeptidase MepM/ murein hydrolase activator NlpD